VQAGVPASEGSGFDPALVLEHAQVSVIVTDLTGAIVDCNRQAEILYGRPRAELIGADAIQFAIDDLAPELLSEIARQLVTERSWEGEFRIRRDDGALVVVRAIDSPIFADDGALRGVVSVAIDITERKRAERRLEAQLAVARVLSEAPTLEEVSQALLSGVGEALGWEVAALWAPPPEGGDLRCVDLWHRPDAEVPAFETASRELKLAPGVGVPGRVWASAQPVWLADLHETESFPRNRAAFADGLRCALAVPLRSGGEMLAVMEFFGREVEEPDDELVRQMTALGAQVGLFLQRLRAEARERQARVRLEVLARVGELLAVELDIEERLQSVARVLLSEFADLAALWLPTSDGLQLVAIAHTDPDRNEALRAHTWPAEPPRAGSPIGRALDEQAPVAVHGDDARRFWHGLLPVGQPDLLDQLRLSSVVCVPLWNGAEPAGVLCFGRDDPGAKYTDGDVLAGQEVARRITMAIENATRFEVHRNAAEVLQHSLLPERLPDVEFARMASRYVPGSSDLTIGGDWFDAIRRDDSHLVFAVGDVAGHGVRAAATMGRARHSLELCISEGLEPEDMLLRMNHFLYDARDTGIVTAAIASFDRDTGSLLLASAGHPPLVVRAPDGSTSFVQVVNGPPLGAVEHPQYEEVLVELPAGAVIVLYTDGLIERRGEALTAGFERLAEVVGTGPAEPDALADHLLATMLDDGSNTDDVAVLVVALTA
jgi:PAS domain S-box-containing protein